MATNEKSYIDFPIFSKAVVLLLKLASLTEIACGSAHFIDYIVPFFIKMELLSGIFGCGASF